MLGWVGFVDVWVCWVVLGLVTLSCVGFFRFGYV